MDLQSLLYGLGQTKDQPYNVDLNTGPQTPPNPFPASTVQPKAGPFPNPLPPSIIPPGTFGDTSGMDPALGLTMIRSPETIAAHMAAKGVPPPADQPEGVGADDATHSLGKALTNQAPGQQGAEEGVLPAGLPPPTPSPESVDSSGDVPEADTSKKPGGLGTNKNAQTSKPSVTSAVDDLAKTLAGLHPIPGIKPPTVSTPAAYHPSNQISRSNLPSVLLQQIGNVTKGTTGPYRLGQALSGVRNV